MSCNDVDPRLDAFIDSELSPSEQVDVARHIAACASCEESVREMLGLRDALSSTANAWANGLNLSGVWPEVESAMDAHDGRQWWRWKGTRRAAHAVPMWAAGVAMAAGALLTMRAVQPGDDPIVMAKGVEIRRVVGDVDVRHDRKHDTTLIFVNDVREVQSR